MPNAVAEMPRSISRRSLAMPMLVRSRNAMTYAAISSGMMRRKISLLMTAGSLIAVACRGVDMGVTFLLEGVAGGGRRGSRPGCSLGCSGPAGSGRLAAAGAADVQAVPAQGLGEVVAGTGDLAEQKFEGSFRHLLHRLDDGGQPDEGRSALRQAVGADHRQVFRDAQPER